MSDYLIHYGVKGMKWGVRKQRPTSGHSRLHRAIEKKEAKRSSGGMSAGKKRSTAKKIAIGAAIVGGTILASYGAYKLHGKAVSNLSKRYREEGARLIRKSLGDQKNSAWRRNEADKARLRGQPDLMKSLMESAKKDDSNFKEHLQRGRQYVNKSVNRDFSKKEQLSEMIRIADPRKGRVFTPSELERMGVDVIEPERVPIDKIPINRAHIRRR